jgi:hypothetical protein
MGGGIAKAQLHDFDEIGQRADREIQPWPGSGENMTSNTTYILRSVDNYKTGVYNPNCMKRITLIWIIKLSLSQNY